MWCLRLIISYSDAKQFWYCDTCYKLCRLGLYHRGIQSVHVRVIAEIVQWYIAMFSSCRAITPLHQPRLFCWIATRTRPLPTPPHPSIITGCFMRSIEKWYYWNLRWNIVTMKKYHGKFNYLHVNAKCVVEHFLSI